MSKHENDVAGVYKITCKVNGKVYIGASKNIYERWDQHIFSTSSKLRNDLDKYGEEFFNIEIIEEIDCEETRKEREQFYIEKFKSFTIDRGYNSLIESKNVPNQRFDTDALLDKMDEYFIDPEYLSELLNLSMSTVERIINGKAVPSKLTFLRMVELFECDSDELVKEANQ